MPSDRFRPMQLRQTLPSLSSSMCKDAETKRELLFSLTSKIAMGRPGWKSVVELAEGGEL